MRNKSKLDNEKSRKREEITIKEAERLYKEISYKNSKRLRYYDYIIVTGFVSLYVVCSFLIAKFLIKSSGNYFEYFTTFGAGLFFFLFIINGFLRNRKSAKFYNNSTKRYQSTLSEDEGFSKRISKIFILISFLLLVTSVIQWIVIWAN